MKQEMETQHPALRTLLLTPCSRDERYATGECIRQLVKGLPADSLLWATTRNRQPEKHDDRYGVFPVSDLHWRLRRTAVNVVWMQSVRARVVARQIEAWARPFSPELLWVMADWNVIGVGLQVARRLKIPLHLTVHDAPRFMAREFCESSPLGVALYIQTYRKLLQRATSVDAVSQPLLENLRHMAGSSTYIERVIGPSIGEACAGLPKPPEWAGAESPNRRICVCGSLRSSPGQWARFLESLGSIHLTFELHLFVDPAYVPETVVPPNCRLVFHEYAPTGEAVVRALRDGGFTAAYAALWREPRMAEFTRTSLSSKLATYAAAGLPVVFDGPRDSAAADLLLRYGAGIVLSDAHDQRLTELVRLLTRPDVWSECSRGSHTLWQQEFCTEKNLRALQALWRESSGAT
jgi:hypothetical protein